MSRFPHIVELEEALESAHERSPGASAARRTCYLDLYTAAVTQLGRALQESDETRLKRLVVRELSEGCSLQPWRENTTGEYVPGVLLARTMRLSLRLALSQRTADHFLVQSAWLNEKLPDASFDQGLHPVLDFRIGRPPPSSDGAAVVSWLLQAVADHHAAAEDARRQWREEEVLREWSNTLRFRHQLEENLHPPISYDGYRVDGNRVIFNVSRWPQGVFKDQPRQIRFDQRAILTGIVDEMLPDELLIWVADGVAEYPPRRGTLEIDNRASRIALERQKMALDALRYGRCVNPSLRELVLAPSTASAPRVMPTEGITWHHADLDADKKRAVAVALGSEDLCVVQGPPGTGKTVFVTELIAQLLDSNPACRILLTSQTHVALDNVLERLHTLRPTARLLRVSQRDDERVSSKVHELTIARVASRWRNDVARATEAYLATTAEAMGVRPDDIRLGLAVGRLRAESREMELLEGLIKEVEQGLQSAERTLEQTRASNVADALAATGEDLEELRSQLRELRERRKTLGARRREAAKALTDLDPVGVDLATAPLPELVEWEKGLLDATEQHRHLLRLVNLAEQWQLRFSESREFYTAMVADSAVVAGTCLGFANVPGMMSAEFDVCIVDEASKSTATELFVPLSRARRWVLVGDIHQLPPFVEDLLDDTRLLDEFGLDRASLQTTLLDRLVGELPPTCLTSLRTQHRMVRAIGDLISTCFYDGDLNSLREDGDQNLRLVLPTPVTWLSTSKLPERDEVPFEGTFKNILEVRAVVQWLRRLDYVARNSKRTYKVGVISGYVGQCVELRRTIATVQGSITSLSIECNTVDAFQGREVDICVYSVTRSNTRGNIGFLRDARRLNVALSRGRTALVVVGDHAFCRKADDPNPLRTVINYMETHPSTCTVIDATVTQ